MQTMKDTQEEKEEGGTRGEDWDEVRIKPFNSYIMFDRQNDLDF